MASFATLPGLSLEDLPMQECIVCENVYPLVSFPNHASRKSGKDNRCKSCKNNLQKIARKLYKSSPPKPKSCQICDKETVLFLDHCHKTDQFRGWICKECNSSLGNFGDDISGILKALKYLISNDLIGVEDSKRNAISIVTEQYISIVNGLLNDDFLNKMIVTIKMQKQLDGDSEYSIDSMILDFNEEELEKLGFKRIDNG
jgi:hypothetical protein